MKKSISIFWFRRDLRIDDNRGLYNALKENKCVLPIFIYDKKILDKLKKNDHRIEYINYSISKINDLLSKKNKSISCFYGNPKEVFLRIINQFEIKKVYTNRDYTPYSIKRDHIIKKLLNENKIEFFDSKIMCYMKKMKLLKMMGCPIKFTLHFLKNGLIK